MCFCDPPEWSSETEDHPWLFTKHSLFYLHRAVTDLCSLPHLSLISDKALFKCLLSWPIHDWRWHLRNNSSVPWHQWGWWVGYGPCPAFKSESLIYLQWGKSCQHSDIPPPQTHQSERRDGSRGWWAQWVITFCNENDRDGEGGNARDRVTHLLRRNKTSRPNGSKRRRKEPAEKNKSEAAQPRLMIKRTATAIIFLMRAAGAYNTFIWQRSASPNSPFPTPEWLHISHDSFIISALFWGFITGQVQWRPAANKGSS